MAGYLNPRQLVSAQLALFERFGGTHVKGAVTSLQKEKDWLLIEEKFSQVYSAHNIPDVFFQTIKAFI